MATTSNAANPAPMADINITPFTDVLLVLLVIFMLLAAMSAPPGFQKQFRHPQPKSPPADILPHHPILVEVTAKDIISVDGKPVTFARLYQTMTAAVAMHDRHQLSSHIVLIADENASYNCIIKILDAARQAGDEDVGFVIQ